MDETQTPSGKKERKKRRVVGSTTPPRHTFTLRMEQSLFDAMQERLKHYDGSQNEYLCYLVKLEIAHAKRFSK